MIRGLAVASLGNKPRNKIFMGIYNQYKIIILEDTYDTSK